MSVTTDEVTTLVRDAGSLRDVAQLLHVHTRTVSRWRAGTTRPTYAQIELLKRAVQFGAQPPGNAGETPN